MKPITFDNVCYRIEGKPVYLNSGEFHYFRVPRDDWRRRMRLFREAGGNCLGTYVPWVVHEPTEGDFAFSRRDFDDLEGFLATAADEGLYVMARPGPYQYSELLYAGLPHWMFSKYPQVLARTSEGEPFRFFVASYTHPVFLARTRAWFEQVCPILARHTVSRGGPIAFTQIDNELTGIHMWFGGPDCNAEAMGIGVEGGRFVEYLRRRYGTVAAMNEATGQAAASFVDVRPPIYTGPSTPDEIRRRKDYFEFYMSVAAEYTTTLADWMKELGIDTPLVHNAINHASNRTLTDAMAAAGHPFVVGGDHYYSLDQNWPQNNPTPQWTRKIFLSLESMRLCGMPQTVYELPAGSLSDWPPLTPQDAKAAWLINVAMGMKGHNYYIYTGGANPPGMGGTSDIYDYGAAIGAFGEVRPLYQAMKDFGLLLRDRPWVCETQREFDVRFAWDWETDKADHFWRGRGGLPLGPQDAWNLMTKGTLTSAFCAGLSPAFCDLDHEDWHADTQRPLVVNGSSMMPAGHQRRLVKFIQGGGRVLILPILPTVDENLRPCTILGEFLGGADFRASGSSATRLTFAGLENVWNNGQLYYPQPLPGGAKVVGTDEISALPVAWRQDFAGGGAAIVLGMTYTHSMREHERMLVALLQSLGMRPIIESSNPSVWCSLATAGRRSMLYLMNMYSSPMSVRVRCRPAWASEPIDTGSHDLEAMSVKCVELNE